MIINHNIAALNTHRQLGANNNAVQNSLEKLSSGLGINKAGDDAAGLAISEKMRGQIRGLEMASKNSQDAISLIQTAEGALSETHSILQRMRELSVQASNDTNQSSVDRDALDQEFQELMTEINDISSQTKFNKKNLLDGSFGNSLDTDASKSTALAVAGVANIDATGPAGSYTITEADGNLTVTEAGGESVTIEGAATKDGEQTINISQFGITIQTNSGYKAADGLANTEIEISQGTGGTFQTGANSGETMNLSIGDMSSSGLSIDQSNLKDRESAVTAMDAIDAAINQVSTERSNLGAKQNRLEHRINNLNASAENLTAAESRIRDVDYAEAA